MKRRHTFDPSYSTKPGQQPRCVHCGAPQYNAIHRARRPRQHGIKPVERAA